jgi:hypothetical protein
MSNSGPTNQEIEAAIDELLNPAPMTIDEALASENPAVEIGRRLGISAEQPMTAAEELYWSVFYFLGDSLNGGVDQALSNSTGDIFDDLQEFAVTYCDPSLSQLLGRISNLFPNQTVPKDRSERNISMDLISVDGSDPFDDINDTFYEQEEVFWSGLVEMATQRKDEFINLNYAGKKP